MRVALALAGALLAAPAAQAAPADPEPYRQTVDCGGFVNAFSGTQHVRVMERDDVVRVHLRFTETDTNTTTGRTIDLRGSATETYDLEAGTRTITGAVYLGRGDRSPFMVDAGRVVLDLETGEVLAMAGPHDGLLAGVDELVCEALR